MSTADHIERRRVRDFENQTAAIESANQALRERGATHFRASIKAMTQEVIVEGWKTFPKDHGDLPL